jgi:hypothetical protein
MRQEVPRCEKCEAERIAAKAYRPSLASSAKAKGRMNWDGEDEDDGDEWEGGEPGIMKVRYIPCLDEVSLMGLA